ncbi:MAG: CPBP family intramembrane glutamic endopeptidase [Candidatus Rokuibacteriota bacterium]
MSEPSIRRRVAVELVALAVLTLGYLVVLPRRPVGLDAGLALFALALVGLTARETRRRIWGPPPGSTRERLRHSATHMLVGTAAVMLLFAVVGALAGGCSLLRPTLAVGLVLFVPWALAQQTLFQFYLLGRLRALLPRASPVTLAILNGILYGLVHLPEWDVTLLTMVGGSVWSWYYLRDRCLTPIALSHAALGTVYFSWVRCRDLAVEWLDWSA